MVRHERENANPRSPLGFDPRSPLGFDPVFAVIGQTRGRARFSREFMNRIPPEFLKISINIDKFTGFFDKKIKV